MRLFFTLFLLSAISITTAQTKNQREVDCYEEYLKVFDNRGADEVADGKYDTVVVSIRTSSGPTSCYMGKAEVRDGFVRRLWIMYEDGTYEEYKMFFKTQDPTSIKNGISRTQVTTDNEQMNVFFITKIKPKKKQPVKAPLPKFELN
jgi:hypothetical protein